MRLVVIRFPDDLKAEAFVQAAADRPELPYAPVAMMQQPTKFCKNDGHRSKNSGWTRGRKYGWWVCSKCKRPSKVAPGWRTIISSAYNLLNPNHATAKYNA